MKFPRYAETAARARVNLVGSAGVIQIPEFSDFLEIWPFQKDLNAWTNLKIKLIIKVRTAFRSDMCKNRPFS